MSRERNEQGQYVGTVTDEAVLAAVRGVAPAPATASDVADELGCTRKAAWEHLTALHEDGNVERKKVGGRSVVWWLTDDPDRDRDREYLKSFGKYAETNIEETAESVGERFDRDLRDRREHRTDEDKDTDR